MTKLTEHENRKIEREFPLSPEGDSTPYCSICFPRNPAATFANLLSVSPIPLPSSLLYITTEPMASPSEIMVDTTWDWKSPVSSNVIFTNPLSSFLAQKVSRSVITFSNCLLIGFPSKSFFPAPAAAITWSLSVMHTRHPLVWARLSAYSPANCPSSPMANTFSE